MTRKDAYILTHYTDIAEAKRPAVRSEQAKVARALLNGLINACARAARRLSSDSRTPRLDRS